MHYGMHIYNYSCLAQLPEIATSISVAVPQEAILLVRGRHFVYREDLFPLELSKKLDKQEVRVGFEILPASFTTSSGEQREAFFDYLDSPNPVPYFPFPAGALREIARLPEKVKVYGLRPLPYEESRGLPIDLLECMKHYKRLPPLGQDDVDEVYSAQIRGNKLDIVVLGESHIEPIKRKLEAYKACVEVVQEDSSVIEHPDFIIRACVTA